MNLPFEELIRLILIAAYKHRAAIGVLFIITTVAAIGIGLNWPKTYSSYATVYVEQRSVIQPLMDGTAVTTDARDRAKIAKEIIFSRKIMKTILEKGGWVKDNMSEIEIDNISQGIIKRARVVNLSGSLIRIEYQDVDPKRAFETAALFAKLLLLESAGTQAMESAQAFEFISKQAKEYHEKLLKAEKELKEFRSNNIDARPGTETEVSTRISELQRSVEATTLKLRETEVRRRDVERQLAGEADITASVTREGQLIKRIYELQLQSDTLSLTYHNDYPDIVRINQQIKDLKQTVKKEKNKRVQARKRAKKGGKVFIDEAVQVNPLYQQLRLQWSQVKIEIATLKERLNETKKLLNTELGRAKRVYMGEADLVELTRDYEVNRDIYQDLLRRRERARVSMNIDKEQSGVSMRIQEPAVFPIRPSGLRFMHFVLGGIVLGLLIPFGILSGLQIVDPRIRYSGIVSDDLKIPVLTTMPHLFTPKESVSEIRSIQLLGIVLVINLGVVVTLSALKYTGAL